MRTDQVFLDDVTGALSDFLARELPRFGRTDWWNHYVLSVLTPSQREIIERRRVTSLAGLDLAALLRVLDQNWNEMSGNLKWPREVRTFVKESQSIRNRWAHFGSQLPKADDIYRDLDTLQRLMQAIGDGNLAEKLGQAKRKVLHGEVHSPRVPKSHPEEGDGAEVRAKEVGNQLRAPAKEIQPRPRIASAGIRKPGVPALVLIGCVKTKLPGRHKAKDLFTSPLFIGRRRRAEGTGVPWFILSAKYGLLAPDSEVESYDVSLNAAGRAERRRWSESVLEKLTHAVGSLDGKVVEVHAGAAYRDFGVVEGLEARGATVVVPLEHARQGEQLAWYSEGAGSAPYQPEEAVQVTAGPSPDAGGAGSGRPTELTSRAADDYDIEAGKQDSVRANSGLGVEGSLTSSANASPVSALSGTLQRQREQSVASRVEIVSATPMEPFTYRWPENTEEFSSGWELRVRFDGQVHRMRHGIGRRHCFGRTRVHSVTWIEGHPVVEGAEAEDFASTRDLVSVLKMPGGNRDAQVIEEVDPAYRSFGIVRHCDAIVGANARRGLAVRIRDDDFESWAHHALLRANAKAKLSTGTSSARKQVPAGADSVQVEATDVVEGLLAYGRRLITDRAGSFTPDAQADAFVRSDAFAFLVAVICDEQVRFEAAWEAPRQLRDRLGHWDVRRIATERDAVRAAFATRPALHRWVEVTADRVVDAAARIVANYHADTGLIWSDRPSAQEVRRRLESFNGIGQKKSAMAAEILERELNVPLRNLTGSDVAVDVHVRRVFLRSGLAARDDVEHIVAVARAAHPERPGELDYPAWEIGREWCRPTDPNCGDCPIGASCPQLIDRADGVRGA